MIVIHIGLKKCASAAIQTFLSVNEEALRGMGIDYPRIGRLRRKAHHNLAFESYRSRKFDPALGSLADLALYWKRQQVGTMVLSSEMFEGSEPEDIARLKSSLPTETCKIVVVLRELLELVPSSYAQKVKFGLHTYGFDEFFDARIQESRVDYFQTISQWAEVFGWKRICVRLLNPGFLTSGNIFDDLLATLGICAQQPGIALLRRPGRINVTPGWKVLEAVRALYDARHGLPEQHPLVREVTRNAHRKARIRGERTGYSRRVGECAMCLGDTRGWNDDRGRYLTRAQAEECIDVYRKGVKALNEWLETPLPLPLDLHERGFTEREFLPDVSRIPSGELRAFYDELGEIACRSSRNGTESEPTLNCSQELN